MANPAPPSEFTDLHGPAAVEAAPPPRRLPRGGGGADGGGAAPAEKAQAEAQAERPGTPQDILLEAEVEVYVPPFVKRWTIL